MAFLLFRRNDVVGLSEDEKENSNTGMETSRTRVNLTGSGSYKNDYSLPD